MANLSRSYAAGAASLIGAYKASAARYSNLYQSPPMPGQEEKQPAAPKKLRRRTREMVARTRRRMMESEPDRTNREARESMSNWQHHQWVKAGGKKSQLVKFSKLERTK